jgi:hypothetical protein
MASIIRTLADANKEAERKAKASKLILDINEADPITKKNVAILIKRDVFGTGPRNAEELIKAMEVCYGIRLGLTSTDPQFQSPAEWAHAFYFEKYPQLLTVGGRGTGKTLPAAAMIHLKCSHREKYSCVHVAADLSQSAAVQRYLLEWADDEGINSGLDRRNLQSKKAYWQNTKSTWWIATGSMSGVSSNHPAMLSLDELEFADELMVEQSWAVPMERDGHKRMWAGFSTRQRASSTMSKLTRMAETGERNIKLMQWSVFETMKPCPSCLCIKGDQVLSEPEKACPLWKWCRGERATKSTGWQSRESVVNLLSTMSEDSFETQMLSLRPPSHGLVLHNFIQDYATNLDLNKGNFLNWVYQPDLPVYAFHDPAENHKSSLLLVQIYQGKIFGFDEIVDESGPTLSKVKEDLENLCRIKGYSIPKAIIVDPRRTDIVKQWREGSPNATGMQRSFNAVVPKMNHGLDEIEAGLELLRSYIRNGLGEVKFYLHPTNCKQHVVAMTQNRYKLTKDNELFDTAKQENKFKDEVDCVRYGIIYLHQQVMPTYRSGISF